MIAADAAGLGQRLTALAEALDRRPLTPAAVQVWMDTLREFSCDTVFSVLESWARSHAKFPAPAEVWRECANIAEARQAKQRIADNDVTQAFANLTRPRNASQYGAECAATIAEFMRSFGKSAMNRNWARRIVAAHAAGGPLTFRHPMTGEEGVLNGGERVSEVQYEMAREALSGGRTTVREREPGEDDE